MNRRDRHNTKPILTFLLTIVVYVLTACTGWSDGAGHPYILWTKDDAAKIRKRIETQDWAKRVYENRIVNGPREMTVIRNLFKYLVMGDAEAGAAEKKELISFIGAVPGQASPQAQLGDRRRAMQWPNVLRYDVLYDILTPEERKGVEDTFRAHAEWQINEKQLTHTHISFLPNMEYSRPMSNQLMALALGDKTLIRDVAHSNGGFVQYMNECVRDSGLYQEEYGKYYSMVFELLLWCRGLDRLGMGELGYDFVGEGGATMKNYLLSLFWLGYPTLDTDTARFEYSRYTDGDAKGSAFATGQHATIDGLPANGKRQTGGTREFSAANMNGGLKLNGVHWWEIGHEKWPDDPHFSYFLAQSRPVADDKYYPTLLVDIDPIDPKTAPPPPAPSAVFPERGMLILRADESPDYWTSPAPAVTMRLAAHYVHRVCDSFALTGFHAFNRTLYANTAASEGYAGGDELWSASIFGHSAVIVDDALPHTVDEIFPLAGSNDGLYKQGKDEIVPGEVTLRHQFGPIAKFAAGRTTNVYDDVDMTRALVLTREYLFDVASLQSPRPRRYLWQVHAIGLHCPNDPTAWAPSEWLYHRHPSVYAETSRVVDEQPWGMTFWQETGGIEPGEGIVGPSWYKRRPGVRMQMLGIPHTIACAGFLPEMRQVSNEMPHDRSIQGRIEPGNSTAVALRNGMRNTAFAALHEPYMDVPPSTAFTRIEERTDAVGVRVRNATVDDRILVSFAPGMETELTGQGEGFRFKSYAFVRISNSAVTVEGGLTALAIRVPGDGAPKLTLNGKPVEAQVVEGVLRYGDVETAAASTPAAPAPVATIAARWDREVLAIREGGDAAARLRLRNCGNATATGSIDLNVEPQLSVSPASIDLGGWKAGEERVIDVTFRVKNSVARHAVWHYTPTGDGVTLQRATLMVGHHVAAFRNWHGPVESDVHVFAPRYHTKLYPLKSGGFTVMIDPAGKRVDMTAPPHPLLKVISETVDRKTGATNEVSRTEELRPYVQMFPKAYSEAAKREGWLEERDQWQHEGTPFKYRFDADWIVLQYYQARGGDKTIEVAWWPLTSIGRDYAREQSGSCKAYTDGKVIDIPADTRGGITPAYPKDLKTVDAVFIKNNAREYGMVQLFAAGSATSGGNRPNVRQPIAGWFGLTFCKEDEFEALARKWVDVRGDIDVE